MQSNTNEKFDKHETVNFDLCLDINTFQALIIIARKNNLTVRTALIRAIHLLAKCSMERDKDEELCLINTKTCDVRLIRLNDAEGNETSIFDDKREKPERNDN